MPLRFLIRGAAVAASCWLSISTALAENRIALVIGNSNYNTVTALPNPANDARAMTKFLDSAGFQVVQAPDLTQSDMRTTIGNFASMVAAKGPDTVAVVFYAGHGLQVDGENYLVPVDARIEREADVPLQAMRLTDVMNALSAVPSKSRIVILDACRNNPFSAINKTGGRGLAIVDAPNGSLVSYSTAPGTEALDGDGQNSPYTTALLKYGQEPGVPIEQVLKRVRLSVSESTGRQQFPWESSSLISDFAFFPGAAGEEQPKLAKAGPASTAQASGSEARSAESWRKELRSKNPREAYEIVVREDRVEAYQAYLLLYPTQPMTPVVRTVLERRQLVIAWYQAVSINTPAAYQSFLATYGSSDYAITANRMLQRALARSLANAGAAFAATCPCTPVTPLPQRQRRTDQSPAPSSPANPIRATPTTVTGVSPPPPTGTGVTAPPAIYPDPTPPVVVVPPPVYIPPSRPPVVVVPPSRPPHGDGKPYPPHGDGKPTPPSTGDGKPTPPSHGDGRPTRPPHGGKPYPPAGSTKPPVGAVEKPPKPSGPPVIYGRPQKPPIVHGRPQKPPIVHGRPPRVTGATTYNPPTARRNNPVHINRNGMSNPLRSSPRTGMPGMGRAAMPMMRPGPIGGMRSSPMGAMGMGRAGMGRMGMGGGGFRR